LIINKLNIMLGPGAFSFRGLIAFRAEGGSAFNRKNQAGRPSPALDKLREVEMMNKKSRLQQGFGRGRTGCFDNDLPVSESDDVGAGGVVTGDGDHLKPIKKAPWKKTSAAKDGIRADNTHGAPDMEMRGGKRDCPSFISHALEEPGELSRAAGIGPAGNAEEGHIASQDNISSFHRAGCFNFSGARQPERLEDFRHPFILAPPGGESHAKPDVPLGGDQGGVADEHGIRMPGQLLDVDHLGAAPAEDFAELTMLSRGLLPVRHIFDVVSRRVTDEEIFPPRRRDDDPAEPVPFVPYHQKLLLRILELKG
jgi:hypothetical protein